MTQLSQACHRWLILLTTFALQLKAKSSVIEEAMLPDSNSCARSTASLPVPSPSFCLTHALVSYIIPRVHSFQLPMSNLVFFYH